MTTKIHRFQKNDFLWVDLSQPTRKDLAELAKELSLPSTTLKDCLRPEHLPKIERFGDLIFVILRLYDDQCDLEADSVQELTRKVAIFWGPNFLVTIHRKDIRAISSVMNKMKDEENFSRYQLLSDLIFAIITSYASPIDIALAELEDMELRIFRGEQSNELLETGYFLKRRASIFRRMLKLSLDVKARFQGYLEGEAKAVMRDVYEEIQHLLFHTEELYENTNNVLNLHLSLSSQKINMASHNANEVMRVLTIFSVFLMPLNLIASIYGMNFEYMPELKSKYGYPMVLSFMILISYMTYRAFKRRGWIT